MKIKSFDITFPYDPSVSFTSVSPLCIFHGRNSDWILDMIQELIGNNIILRSLQHIDDSHFVIHSDIEIDNKSYSVCYIKNADPSHYNKVAVNFSQNSMEYSTKDTEEYMTKIKSINRDPKNVFSKQLLTDTLNLSESDAYKIAFDTFLDNLPCDDTPIFIYDFFNHIDESKDILKYLEKLSRLKKQVFISLSPNYPTEKLMNSEAKVIFTY
ncbi:MAG: hypothetical protein E7675_05260 [Ruminococcaceae bacterium]|nr:hypothetical protein [Oscillospiraceae bacterium]